MGLVSSSVYLDSCLAIYLVEENALFAPKLEIALKTKFDSSFCVSPLTEMECLIMPLREQNEPLIAKFENWFETIEVIAINSEIFRKAARFRADNRALKTPDALHLATALHHNCDEFWTNDNRLNAIAPSLVKNVLNK